MKTKLLVEKKMDKIFSKSIAIFESPMPLRPAATKIGEKILNFLAKSPDFPKNIAKELGIDEQVVYYYIHKLEKSGLIKVEKEEKVKGVLCKYYKPSAKAYGFELSQPSEEAQIETTKEVTDFFSEFVGDGIFNGSIVVGSPSPHGPFLTSARDGHYAVQLALFLGNLCSLPKKYIVKLDTEVKAEHEEKRNMILIGGPITNIISNEINQKLKIRFIWDETWSIFSEFSNKKYFDDDIALIAKISNIWDHNKKIILFSGLRLESTKISIVAITHFYDKILKGYNNTKDFYALIRGLDRDGDGKVDDIALLEHYNQ